MTVINHQSSLHIFRFYSQRYTHFILTSNLVLAPDRQHKGSNAFSIRTPVVDEERMRPGHWLRTVLRVSISVLTPLASDRKVRKNVSLIQMVLFRNKWVKKLLWNWRTQVYLD